MNSQMSRKVHHHINVGVRLAAIGKLNVNGRTHQITPLELSTEKILFLCSWDIPVTFNIKLTYELDDSYDRLIVSSSFLTREVWKESNLYTARLQATENEKLRITGMLNRLMYLQYCDTPIRLYTNIGTAHHNRRPISTIIQ
ncbi:hypothetical protein [Paenibacillus sp. GCM10028914]|uniref:hypothetical protein n=1 Tax=Paenibacillus sp. GCM10028914 TaxID=3273416 RepID=UPI00361EF4EC